ncbi:MAG: transcription elongation factor GreA [bacterium]
MNDNIQYLTQKGYDELNKERDNLKDYKIPEIATKIDEAKQQGDLSENAEYHQAKEDMAWAQGRLLELNHILENAQIMQTTTGSSKIIVGSSVKFKNPQGQEKEYTIVGPTEADPISGRISNESPIGQAFLDAEAGDKIKVKTPAGEQEYQIIEIK